MDGVLQGIEPDYEYYSDAYHGTLGEAAFAVWPHVDLAPCGERVKMAVCSVADAIGNPERRRTSYRASDVSESYDGPGFSLTAEAAIRRWLGGLGILKRGRWL